MNIKKWAKKLLVTTAGCALVASMTVGCSQTKEENPKAEPDKQVVSKDIKVCAPDGLPAISIAKLAKENPQIKNGYNLTYTIEKTPETLSTTVMKQEPDIAIVPSNMASIAYNKTSNYQIAGTVGMGSFYLVSTEDIKDFSDLVGREVGNTGKGLTPDITVKAILKEKGINTEDINFTYVNSASELVPLLATGKISTGFVPEPALTGLMAKNPNIKIIKSLNDGWKETFKSEQGYPQSTIIVKKDLIKDNAEFVNEFLVQLLASISWANTNGEKAGEYAKKIGVTVEPKIIGKSIERANLKYIPIKDTIEDYNNYYQKLADFDAKTVGGKLPDEGIYFKGE
ncbi:ABC transporter substrate-binding protein [Romboutsia sp.]|uniref:ABC transporter substrate-binding protein n=1 Tax=Romboutsia sp. TaxID=1965302 RepID=UPI003F408CEE